MDEPVYITAQEAAERLLTIKIAGVLLLVLVIGLIAWIIVRWKYTEDRRRTEAENARDRIQVTERIGTAMTQVLKEDSGWKVQYFALKAKYDALMQHSENMEKTLESATGRNGFTPQFTKEVVTNV